MLDDRSSSTPPTRTAPSRGRLGSPARRTYGLIEGPTRAGAWCRANRSGAAGSPQENARARVSRATPIWAEIGHRPYAPHLAAQPGGGHVRHRSPETVPRQAGHGLYGHAHAGGQARGSDSSGKASRSRGLLPPGRARVIQNTRRQTMKKVLVAGSLARSRRWGGAAGATGRPGPSRPVTMVRAIPAGRPPTRPWSRGPRRASSPTSWARPSWWRHRAALTANIGTQQAASRRKPDRSAPSSTTTSRDPLRARISTGCWRSIPPVKDFMPVSSTAVGPGWCCWCIPRCR